MLQGYASEFINFVTSDAVARTIREKRRTLTGEDILYSMRCLMFSDYIVPMEIYRNKIKYVVDFQKKIDAEAEDMSD
ncbi:hypothetical protein MHBO_000577 [Bonamia ostreae]|uniref:Transcription factor CBF/NF-Y/archaeal histone domain-containing protein n=1 Tax=Bonamia ostreae TaxID=126728 RepID=A0ABV2AG20_9EUKA